MVLDDILTGECWLLFPGVDCAPGHFSIVKWLLGAGGGPTPPGFPAKVQSVFFISFSFFCEGRWQGCGAQSSGESSEVLEKVDGRFPVSAR